MGVSADNPEKMEHFGISVVEAIGNGLIPLVFDCAGPAEVLVDFPELRFSNITDLVEKTKAMQKMNPDMFERLQLIPPRYEEGIFFKEFRKLIGA
jgi:hypothetical protein